MIDKLISFLEDRTGLPSAMSRLLDGPPRLSALGQVIFALLLLQAGTGFALSLHYAPTTTDAWGSVYFLQTSLPLGGWTRALHHWGTSALVVSLSLHLLLIACSGGYRRPGEVSWWLAVGLLGVVFAFAITGNPLPWDQAGYWGLRVESEIIGGMPVVGPSLRALFLGGNEAGNLTLTRMYALHAIALPAIAAGIGAALWKQAGRHRLAAGKRWVVFAAPAAVAAVVGAAWLWPPGMTAPAEASSSYQAVPAWYFLPLNQLISWIPSQLAAQTLPLAAVVFLLALPLLDRGTTVGARLPWLGGIGAGVLGVLGLIVSGVATEGDPDLLASARQDAARAQVVAADGIPPEGAGQMMARDPLTRGKRLFAAQCAACHLVGGKGTDEPNGPDLAGYLSREWIEELIRDPSDPRFFGTTEIDEMEAYHDRDAAEVAEVAAFVAALREHPETDPDDLPAALAAGLVRFEDLECASCHELIPGEEGAAPNLAGYGSDSWLTAFMRHPDSELFYGASNEMPSFEVEELSEEELMAVIAWLRHLETLPVAEKTQALADAAPEAAGDAAAR